MTDGRVLFWLLVSAPLWIPVTVISGIWFGITALVGRLPLPTAIGGPIGLAMLAAFIPLYPVVATADVTKNAWRF